MAFYIKTENAAKKPCFRVRFENREQYELFENYLKGLKFPHMDKSKIKRATKIPKTKEWKQFMIEQSEKSIHEVFSSRFTYPDQFTIDIESDPEPEYLNPAHEILNPVFGIFEARFDNIMDRFMEHIGMTYSNDVDSKYVDFEAYGYTLVIDKRVREEMKQYREEHPYEVKLSDLKSTSRQKEQYEHLVSNLNTTLSNFKDYLYKELVKEKVISQETMDPYLADLKGWPGYSKFGSRDPSLLGANRGEHSASAGSNTIMEAKARVSDLDSRYDFVQKKAVPQVEDFKNVTKSQFIITSDSIWYFDYKKENLTKLTFLEKDIFDRPGNCKQINFLIEKSKPNKPEKYNKKLQSIMKNIRVEDHHIFLDSWLKEELSEKQQDLYERWVSICKLYEDVFYKKEDGTIHMFNDTGPLSQERLDRLQSAIRDYKDRRPNAKECSFLNEMTNIISSVQGINLKNTLEAYNGYLCSKLTKEFGANALDSLDLKTLNAKNAKQKRLIARYEAIHKVHEDLNNKNILSKADYDAINVAVGTCQQNKPGLSELSFLQILTTLIDALLVKIPSGRNFFFSKEKGFQEDLAQDLKFTP